MSHERELETPFRSMVRASGLGEVWTHSSEMEKFKQFGWRCTNSENAYNEPTLVGNWNEKQFDISRMKEAKTLPSQYDHYFDSVHNSSYNRQPYKVPEELKHLKSRHSHAFPGHQPELDNQASKAIYNSWQTTNRSSFVDPRIRERPVENPPAVPSDAACVEQSA